MARNTELEKKKEKPRYNMWQNAAYMIELAWKNRGSILFFCTSSALLTVANSLAELYIAPVILGKLEIHAALMEVLWTIAVFALALMICAGLQSYIGTNQLYGRVELRTHIYALLREKYLTTSYPNGEDGKALRNWNKATAATSSNAAATEAVWNTLTELLSNTLCFCIYLTLLSWLDPLLLAVVLATTITGYYLKKYINEWGYRHREEDAQYGREMWYLRDAAGQRTRGKDIRIFGMRAWMEDVYNGVWQLYRAFLIRREKVYLGARALDILLSFLRNGVAYFYLISMAIDGRITASEFLLLFSAIGGFTGWVTGIFSNLTTLHGQSLDLSVIREYLELPEPFLFERGKHLSADMQDVYELQLKNVSFRYPKAREDTLQNLDLTIKNGEKLAVVGLNGAGKTTLVKLLCGYYDPTEGQVLLNGQDIRQYNRADYYKLFSGVFQEFSVLEVSLAENVAQCTEDAADMDRVKECVELAGLTERVKTLPDGYRTHIGRKVYDDGVELSGGETQRLMLARALYKDAPMIVLDEPTAALDPIAENDIYLKYNELVNGRTSIYISHRLASTRFCDRILFLENGRIAEEGDHETLMAAGGKYAELFRVQSRYYQEGYSDEEEQ